MAMNATDGGRLHYESLMLYTLSAIELVLHLFGLPVSGLNMFLIGRTPLIHWNLKFILQYQSAAIILRGFGRLAICALKFILADPIKSEAFEPWHFIYALGGYNRNFIPHILIIERILATVMSKNYEAKKFWPLSFIWATIVFLVSLHNALSTSAANNSLYGLLTNICLLILGILELSLFVWLWSYNTRKYKNSIEQKSHSLTERYQLSENIRIGKQLTPTVVLELLNLAIVTAYLSLTYFSISYYPNIMLMVVSTLVATFQLFIEASMITYHPFLRRDFGQMLKRVQNYFCCRKSRVGSDDETIVGQISQIAMRNIINGELLIHPAAADAEEHIAMLKKSWEGKGRP